MNRCYCIQVYFKERIEVKPDVEDINGVDLEKVVKDSFKQLQDQSIVRLLSLFDTSDLLSPSFADYRGFIGFK